MQLSSYARKAVAAGLTASTLLWSAMLVAPQIASAAVHSEGCLVLSGGTVWMITGGTRRGYTSAEVFQSWGRNFSEVQVASAEDIALPVGPIQVYADGTLVKGPNDPLVYLVTSGQKRPFVSGSVFTGLGFSFANIQQAPSNTFADLPTGANLDSSAIAHPAGVQVISNGAVWWMSTNGRMGFASAAQFNSYGYMFSHVVAANSMDLALPNLGNVPDRAACTGGGTPPPVSGSFSVSLASDNPVAGTHASGSAYNSALKLSFTAGSSPVSISGVSITRTGISTDSAISGIAAFDLSGMRLTNSFVSLADGKALLTFASPLSISANSSTTVTIKTNVSGTSGTYALALASASDVVSSGGVSGNFPITGNTFTLANGGSIVGGVTLDAVQIVSNGTADVTAVNVNLGTLNQQVSKFRFVASSNEDVIIKSVTMYNNGNSNDGDMTNLKLLAPDGSTLASLPQTSGRYAKFVLANPYKILKGNTRDLAVNVDVVNGSTRNFRLVIQNDYDVEVSGVATGSGILVTAAAGVDTAFPIGDSVGANCGAGITCINKITVASGTGLFNKASDSPSGNIASGGTAVTLGKWEFTPQGENMEIRQLGYTLTTSTVNVTSILTGTVRIKINGSTVLSFSPAGASPQTSAGTSISTFPTIAANQKAIMTIEGDVLSSATAGSSIVASLDVTQVKRISTGDLVDPTATNTAANTLTVSTAALSVAKNSSFGDTTVVAGLSNAKVGSFNLTASSTEDVNVSSITVGLTNTTNVSNLTLMSGATQLGSVTTTPQASNVVSMSGFVIPKGTTVQVDVMLTTNSATTSTEVTSLTAVSANGQSSSATVTATGITATGQTITFSVAGTMTVTLDTTNTPVLGIAHSGEVDRTLLATRLTSNNAETIKVTTVQVSATNGTASLRDLKLFVNGVQKGNTVQLNSGVASFTDNSVTGLFSVNQDTTATLTVKGSTTSSGTLNSQAVGNLSIDFIQALGVSGGTTIKPGSTLVTTWTAGTASATGGALTVGDTTGFHAGDVVLVYDVTNGASLGIVSTEPTTTTSLTVAATTSTAFAAGPSTVSKIGSGASTAASTGGGAVGTPTAYTVTSTKAFSVNDPVITVGATATRLGVVTAIGSGVSMTIASNGATTGTGVYVAKLGTDTGIATTTTASLTTTATSTLVASSSGFYVGDMIVAVETGSDGVGTGAVAGTTCIVTAIADSTHLTLQCKAAVTVANARLVRVGQANPSTTLVTTAASAGTRALATAAATVSDSSGFGIGDVIISAGSTNTGSDLGKVTAVGTLSVTATGSAAAGTFARLTRLPGAASAGTTITFHDVEPTVSVNSAVAGGSSTGQSGQAVAAFDVKADGDRNMNITVVNVQANGNNLPWNYVTSYDLYNGSTLLSSASPMNRSVTGAGAQALDGTALKLCSAAPSAGNELNIGGAGVTEAANHIKVNDSIVVFLSVTNYFTAKVTATAVGTACTGAVASQNLTLSNYNLVGAAITSTTATAFKSFNVYFDSTASTPLATQTVTAGSTLTLTVKADTTAVKTGLSTGTASFNTKINGVQGASNGGLSWTYTPSGGSVTSTLTSSDSYPVNGPTFNY